MRRIALAAVVCLVAVTIVGCGTLFNDHPQRVLINSNPAGATISVDGEVRGQTPTEVVLDTRRNYTITATKDGYNDATLTLNRELGVLWIVLDILGGLIPLIIDAATGEWYELPESLFINMSVK
jgi:hypothetical protein